MGTCEPTYSEEALIAAKMNVKDLPFPDGHPPSDDIITQWLEVVNDENCRRNRPVSVHCVAGLGRAPVLVAIAVIASFYKQLSFIFFIFSFFSQRYNLCVILIY